MHSVSEVSLHLRIFFFSDFVKSCFSCLTFCCCTEALNETAYGKGLVARGKHYLIFGSKTSAHPTLQGRERLLQNQVLVPNWLFFDDVSSTSYDDWMTKYSNIVSFNCSLHFPVLQWRQLGYHHKSFIIAAHQFSMAFMTSSKKLPNDVIRTPFSYSLQAIRTIYSKSSHFTEQHSSIGLSLPQNVYLMTFEPWKDDSRLIRFEHLLEKDEDPNLSAPVRFNLADVFPGNDIELKEVSLSANQWIEDFSRMHFNQENSSDFLDVIERKANRVATDATEITLQPMEIRTFIMTLSPSVWKTTTNEENKLFRYFFGINFHSLYFRSKHWASLCGKESKNFVVTIFMLKLDVPAARLIWWRLKVTRKCVKVWQVQWTVNLCYLRWFKR